MKSELRNDDEHQNQSIVTIEKAEAFAREIGAIRYVECSAMTQDGLDKVTFY